MEDIVQCIGWGGWFWVGFFFSPPLPVFPLLTHITSVGIVSREGRGGEPRPALHKKSEAGGPGGLLAAGTRGRAGGPAQAPPVTGLTAAAMAPAHAGQQRQ